MFPINLMACSTLKETEIGVLQGRGKRTVTREGWRYNAPKLVFGSDVFVVWSFGGRKLKIQQFNTTCNTSTEYILNTRVLNTTTVPVTVTV